MTMAEEKTRCPIHGFVFQELDGAMRCPFQGCTHFVDLPAKVAPVAPVESKPAERRDDGRGERDEAFAMEKEIDDTARGKSKKKK
jgi:rubredoxin